MSVEEIEVRDLHVGGTPGLARPGLVNLMRNSSDCGDC